MEHTGYQREIEKKFLVCTDHWRQSAEQKITLKQGYLAAGEGMSMRIRLSSHEARLNIKFTRLALHDRDEFDYPVPMEDGRRLLAKSKGQVIEKERWKVTFASHKWEIDVFEKDNHGLVVAEIELEDIDEDFMRPKWLGTEVTNDKRYYNFFLSQHPYSKWGAPGAPCC